MEDFINTVQPIPVTSVVRCFHASVPRNRRDQGITEHLGGRLFSPEITQECNIGTEETDPVMPIDQR